MLIKIHLFSTFHKTHFKSAFYFFELDFVNIFNSFYLFHYKKLFIVYKDCKIAA